MLGHMDFYYFFFAKLKMQDKSQDTEWNDALRKHGIIPEKKEVEITQDQIEHLMDNVIKQRTEEKPLNILSLDELDEKEDDEDDRVLQQIRYFCISFSKGGPL